MNGSIRDLLTFLQRLKTAHIHYSLGDSTEGAIMVLIAVPGERWEVEFHADGQVDVESFVSAGGVHGSDRLEDLFRRFSD
jgi:hypothetical protein